MPIEFIKAAEYLQMSSMLSQRTVQLFKEKQYCDHNSTRLEFYIPQQQVIKKRCFYGPCLMDWLL